METTLRGQKEGGFTLVELMVSLAMTAFLIGAIYLTFGVQRQRFATEEQIIEIQQNGRVAMEFLSREVRMAGFWGCSTPGVFTNTLRGQATDILYRMFPVEGLNNVAAGNSYGAKGGTDILFLSYANGESRMSIKTDMGSNTDPIHVSTHGLVAVGDIVVISDCSHTSVFQVTNVDVAADGNDTLRHDDNSTVSGSAQVPGNQTADLAHQYGNGSFAYPMIAKHYWVTSDNTLRVNGNTNPIAQNIENLQLEYGTDNNGDKSPDLWNNAANVANWSSVIAVRIHIQTRTAKEEKGFTNTRTYSFQNMPGSVDDRAQTGPYNDRYNRFVVERSVALRNRWF
jgi:type IV pilus assembly protein PilW